MSAMAVMIAQFDIYLHIHEQMLATQKIAIFPIINTITLCCVYSQDIARTQCIRFDSQQHIDITVATATHANAIGFVLGPIEMCKAQFYYCAFRCYRCTKMHDVTHTVCNKFIMFFFLYRPQNTMNVNVMHGTIQFNRYAVHTNSRYSE